MSALNSSFAGASGIGNGQSNSQGVAMQLPPQQTSLSAHTVPQAPQ
jgi:hypothetical protein